MGIITLQVIIMKANRKGTFSFDVSKDVIKIITTLIKLTKIPTIIVLIKIFDSLSITLLKLKQCEN